MKEITRISLASLPYNVEIEAKKELEKYLHAVEHSLGADADAMKEIESRVAELLADRGVSGEKVISIGDVKAVKSQLGEPKDFADESSAKKQSDAPEEDTSEKKMMRDPSNQLIGGVCSGLAAYAHVDVAMMRLGWVLMTFFTGGFMILAYLIMWIIMPPARTAAERLQMQGKPVTLEAIQDESIIVSRQQRRDKAVLATLRILGGIGALLVGVLGLMAIVAITYHVSVDQDARLLTKQEWAYFVTLILAGVAFVTFCMTLARGLFVNRYTKRFWITLGVLTALGIGLFSTGVAGFGMMRSSGSSMFDRQWVRTTVESSAVAGAKQLSVQTNMPFTLTYTVDPSRTSATVKYSTFDVSLAPTVRLVRSGDRLTVLLNDNETSCQPGNTMCVRRFEVAVVGPALDAVESQQNVDITYHAAAQNSLRVTANDNSNLTVESEHVIDTVDVLVTKGSTVSFLPASVNTLNVTTEGPQTAALVATVKTLNLHIPDACSLQDQRGMINIAHADSVSINNKSYDASTDYPCTDIRFIPRS